ncbi:MAG: hypothetical protein KBD16_02265 [Candidatus Pacebacteria bacterium]|nr:hypothetical protein [Candidatus Paceibacterota bacterium]
MKKGLGVVISLIVIGAILLIVSIVWKKGDFDSTESTTKQTGKSLQEETGNDRNVPLRVPSDYVEIPKTTTSITEPTSVAGYSNEIRILKPGPFELVARPGEKMTFHILAPSNTKSLMLIGDGALGEGIKQYDNGDGSATYTLEITIPDEAAGFYNLQPFAYLQSPTGSQLAGKIIAVSVDLSNLKIDSIELTNSSGSDGTYDGSVILPYQEIRRFRVVGLFNDGVTRDITSSGAGTTYTIPSVGLIDFRNPLEPLSLIGLSKDANATLIVSNALASRDYKFLVEVVSFDE